MYKNWKTISQITDTHFMWALVLLDVSTDFGQMVIKCLPEFFADEEQLGPYPFSIMRQEAHRRGAKHDGIDNGEDHIASYGGVPDHIPLKYFGKPGGSNVTKEMDILPSEIDQESKPGQTVTWGGKQLVVIENNDSCWEIVLAPAELIAVDK